MSKIIIFSHESDIDGMGSVVLAKLAFEQVDYVLLPDIETLEITFRKYIELNSLSEYERIYVTDLALYEPSLSMVADSDLKDKTYIFDHHQKAIDENMNKYNFTKIIEKDETGTRCGTELFYEYLCKNSILISTPAINTFVEYTRLEDTGEWQYNQEGVASHNLEILYNILGQDEYIKRMVKKLKENQLFNYSYEEKILIEAKKIEARTKIENIMSNALYLKDKDNNNFVIVESEYEYRNDLSEYIIRSNNPYNVRYLIIVALNKGKYGQKSFKSIEKNFDVNVIATKYGGGGHQTTAGQPITEENRRIYDSLPLIERLKFIAER